MVIEMRANIGAESKSGWNWQANTAHFGKISTLATKKIPTRCIAIGAGFAEIINPLYHISN
jgi:hypothetical protein